jgi:hypothetical protein
MTAYYNEIDPFCAQWLRNLILRAAGNALHLETAQQFIRAVMW